MAKLRTKLFGSFLADLQLLITNNLKRFLIRQEGLQLFIHNFGIVLNMFKIIGVKSLDNHFRENLNDHLKEIWLIIYELFFLTRVNLICITSD